MLFSNQEIADYINENFEPSWESVRPVPRVSIDFGNGTVIERTLHGNVATYICDSNQIVEDVLPGIYSKTAFLKQLKQITAEWRVTNNAPVNRTVNIVTEPNKVETTESQRSPELGATAAQQKLNDNLELDTAYNEQTRRKRIKSYLVAHPQSTPAAMKPWLYREVLHADLDDPYLGLRAALFDNYPFVDN